MLRTSYCYYSNKTSRELSLLHFNENTLQKGLEQDQITVNQMRNKATAR